MAGPGLIIRDLHRLRKSARDLKDQLDRFPQRLRLQQTKVKKAEDALREAQDHLKKLKVATHEKEVSLKSTHGQIARHQKQLDEAKGSKEFEALQHEMAAERTTAARLEDEILTAMTEIEEQTATLPVLEKTIQTAKEEFATFERTAEERKADLGGQLAVLEAQIVEVEKSLPAAVRSLYDRIVGAMGADAMAALRGRSCSSCYSEVTAQMYNDLVQNAFVTCKSCARVLYLPESTRPVSDT